MSDNEKQVFMRTMLAIAQIEVAVKSFWSDIHKTLPKPEIASVGITF
jgi:ribonucleoside-diphosphate reductase beta chain